MWENAWGKYNHKLFSFLIDKDFHISLVSFSIIWILIEHDLFEVENYKLKLIKKTLPQ